MRMHRPLLGAAMAAMAAAAAFAGTPMMASRMGPAILTPEVTKPKRRTSPTMRGYGATMRWSYPGKPCSPAQERRKAMKRRAVKRARRLGHA